jgi:hypothetical protein
MSLDLGKPTNDVVLRTTNISKKLSSVSSCPWVCGLVHVLLAAELLFLNWMRLSFLLFHGQPPVFAQVLRLQSELSSPVAFLHLFPL